MKYYPVGMTWETKGYNCEIIGSELITQDGDYHWMTHKVNWVAKYGNKRTHYKNMSTKKLEKEFRRIGIVRKPENQAHFEDELFSM